MALRSWTFQFGSVALAGFAIACAWHVFTHDQHDKFHADKVVKVNSPPMWEALEKKAKAGPSQASARRRQMRSFPIMRSVPEGMPSSMEGHIRVTTGAPPAGLNTRTAQRLHTSDGDVWIVNGRSTTCIVKGALACTTTADFAAHGLVLGMAKSSKRAGGPPRDFQLLGLAPKWVRAVQVTIGRAMRRIPVRFNAYAMRSDVPSFVVGFCKGMHQACQPLRVED
jgi:hypothetical protein